MEPDLQCLNSVILISLHWNPLADWQTCRNSVRVLPTPPNLHLCCSLCCLLRQLPPIATATIATIATITIAIMHRRISRSRSSGVARSELLRPKWSRTLLERVHPKWLSGPRLFTCQVSLTGYAHHHPICLCLHSAITMAFGIEDDSGRTAFLLHARLGSPKDPKDLNLKARTAELGSEAVG